MAEGLDVRRLARADVAFDDDRVRPDSEVRGAAWRCDGNLGLDWSACVGGWASRFANHDFLERLSLLCLGSFERAPFLARRPVSVDRISFLLSADCSWSLALASGVLIRVQEGVVLLPAIINPAEGLFPWAGRARIFNAKAVGANAELLASSHPSGLRVFRVAALLRLVFPRIADKAAWSRSWWVGPHGILELSCAMSSVVEVSRGVDVIGNAME